MRFPVFLSIDWDFAIVIDDNELTWDWFEAREDRLRDFVWHHRLCYTAAKGINPIELTPLGIDPEAWWKPFANLPRAADCRLTVSESHVMAYEHITRLIRTLRVPLEVWQYDAHGDLGYGKRPPSRTQPTVNAEDWLGTLIRSDLVYPAVQNYPSYALEPKHAWPKKWRRWYAEDQVAFAYHAESDPLAAVSDRLDRIEIVGVHICRSGAWSPPYHDPAFIRFVQACPLGAEPEVLGADYANPLKPRKLPTEEDIEQYRRLITPRKEVQ